MSCDRCEAPRPLFTSPAELDEYVAGATAVDPETGDKDVLGAFCFEAMIEGWYYRAEFDPATCEIRTLHRHTRDPLVAMRET